MLTSKEYEQYTIVFNEVKQQNQKFLSRFPGFPASLNGMKILEIGCGHGALCYELAQKGADLVVGADLDLKRIEFAQKHLAEIDPRTNEHLSFIARDINELPDNDFDMVISKSTFEHVMNLEAMLKTIARLLKPGGKLYSGFGPLYNSFDGDHKLITRIPWGHLLMPEKMQLDKFYKKTGNKVYEKQDMTFNMLPFAEYERIFRESEFKIEYFKVNASDNPIMALFSALRFNSALRELFSRNIYCVLVKPV